MDKPVGDLSRPSLRLLLFQRVDQLNGREEPDPLVMMFDGLDTDGRGDMRLARAGTADEDDVVGVAEEVAAMKLTDQRLVDLTAGEVEAVQITIGRKAGRLELVGSRSHFTFRGLGLEELRQDGDCRLERWRSLLRELADGLCHAVHLQLPQIALNHVAVPSLELVFDGQHH